VFHSYKQSLGCFVAIKALVPAIQVQGTIIWTFIVRHIPQSHASNCLSLGFPAISCRFDELRKVIPTEDTKVDKAAFLHISVDYIRNLQALLQRAIDEGALDNLSEESQWALRMLLPRWDPHSACPKPAPYPKVAAASQLASDDMTAPYPKVSTASHLAAAPAMGRVDNLVEPQPMQAAINMPTVPARAVTNADVDPTMFMATAGACMLNMMQQQQQALLSVLVASQSVKKVTPLSQACYA
jgi:hypothetical protein